MYVKIPLACGPVGICVICCHLFDNVEVFIVPSNLLK